MCAAGWMLLQFVAKVSTHTSDYHSSRFRWSLSVKFEFWKLKTEVFIQTLDSERCASTTLRCGIPYALLFRRGNRVLHSEQSIPDCTLSLSLSLTNNPVPRSNHAVSLVAGWLLILLILNYSRLSNVYLQMPHCASSLCELASKKLNLSISLRLFSKLSRKA